MAVQVVQAFVPAIAEEELSGALSRSLARRGYGEPLRLRLPAAAAAEVGGRASGQPGGAALAWFRPAAAGAARPAVLDWTFAGRRRWDPALVRALSAEVGGFAGAVEAAGSRDEAGAALFYAGRTVELAGRDPGHPDGFGSGPPFSPGLAAEEALARYEGWFREATEGLPGDLRWPTEDEVNVWLLAPPADDDPDALELEGPTLARAVFPYVSEETFRTAAAGLSPRPGAGEGWRWLARQAPTTGISYVLLERQGGLDMDLVRALAERCASGASALELPPQGWPFRWLEVDGAGKAESGIDHGAAPLLRLWGRVTVEWAEAAGILRWPAEIPGQPL